MSTLRPELTPLPSRMTGLALHRGYPVPWFVEWISDGKACKIGDGEPDFRIMSRERLAKALHQRRCWVCGKTIHGNLASFTIGPMCAVNRTSAEPPSHRDCALWSAVNCPFLSRPHAKRREAQMPAETVEAAGIAILRNPGVALVWTSRDYHPYQAPGGVLFYIGEPVAVSWWCEGREATRAEVKASIDGGLSALMEVAELDGEDAVNELHEALAAALTLAPA